MVHALATPHRVRRNRHRWRKTASGLHYNYFRDYDPRTGRYVQSDPIGLGGGISTFAYVSGRPLVWQDPKGLDGSPFCGGASGLLPPGMGNADAASCIPEPAPREMTPEERCIEAALGKYLLGYVPGLGVIAPLIEISPPIEVAQSLGSTALAGSEAYSWHANRADQAALAQAQARAKYSPLARRQVENLSGSAARRAGGRLILRIGAGGFGFVGGTLGTADLLDDLNTCQCGAQ